MKTTMLTTVLLTALLVVALVGVCLALRHQRETARRDAKAERFDEVCRLVKSSLRTDRMVLREPKARDLVLWNFAGRDVGDGFQSLEWCVPRADAMVSAVRECHRLGSYSCAASAIESMERAIDVR